ncbi:putative transcription factor C2H2 family [Helianthus debilis subsp. tardiflorus]
MGSLCSCFRSAEPDDESVDSDDNEQLQDSGPVVNRNAQDNFTLFIQNLTNKCEAVLGRRGTETSSWFYQGQSSSQPNIVETGSSGSSSSSSGISMTRHDKGSNRSRVEPEPVFESNFLSIPSEEGSKKFHSEIPPMVAFDKVKSNVNTISVDDEDVCPICLEEYTFENPRIITKCLHHYHLSCIYEWNERSETCPVCSKLMVFEEMD